MLFSKKYRLKFEVIQSACSEYVVVCFARFMDVIREFVPPWEPSVDLFISSVQTS